MKSGKGHHEEEEEEEDEVGTKHEATPSNNNTKDGKNNDKANAIRSKHSVTEQRRRSKINERFQILRDLIPNTDQKRDTASFLLEVIQYVQFLQEKVQKHEGSYQPWSSEPTKLMPWRNSHWRMQAFPVQPQALTNGTGPGLTYPGTFEENPTIVTSTMQANQQNPTEAHPSRDILFKAMDQQNELANKAIPTMPLHASMPVPVPNDSAFVDSLPRPASDECPNTNDAQNQQEELAIEGGTISVSSSYSKELLNSLTQALQSTGLDLSQATISVQINLGKQANRGMTSGPSIRKDNEDPPPSGNQQTERYREASNDEDLDQAQKRLKI